jgi:hypothetical protein
MEVTKKTKKILRGHAPTHYKDADKDVLREELPLKGDVEQGKHHYLVLRPKSPELAENSAIVCEYCCEINNIHYSQDGRSSLWDYLISENTANRITSDDNIEEIKRKLLAVSDTDETLYVDCSSFVATCAKIGGAWNALSGLPTTAIAEERYNLSGLYELFYNDTYTKSLDYLKRGDILIARKSKGCTYDHATMVLGNGELAPLDMTVSSAFSVKTSPTVNIEQITHKSVSLKVTAKETYDLLDSYSWELQVTSPQPNATLPENSSVSFNKNTKVSGLDSNTLYFIKVVGTNKKNKTDTISTANSIFKTEPERPSPVSNLFIKQLDANIPIEKLLIQFDAATSWPSNTKDKFYRIYLAVGGKIIDYFDRDVVNGEINILEILVPKFYITYNNQIQVGVQAGYNKSSPIFDSDRPRWSNIITVKSDLKLIDKIFIKVKNTFDRLILSMPKIKKR